MFRLPDLPYDYDALSPVISEETMHFHHDKHHAAYVKTLNEMLEQAGQDPGSLEEVVTTSASQTPKKLFNNAAQAWNHAFFWTCMSPERQSPDADLTRMIEAFGGMEKLKSEFVTAGVGQFGSGWVWLSAGAGGGSLEIIATHDADNPLVGNRGTPLLVCDVWEHAYYLDYQNDRKGFLETWFDSLPNWRFAGRQLAAAKGDGQAWRYAEA